MHHTRLSKEREVVNIAKIQEVPLIKIGTGMVQIAIVRVGEVAAP
jgi:hypothetical protein